MSVGRGTWDNSLPFLSSSWCRYFDSNKYRAAQLPYHDINRVCYTKLTTKFQEHRIADPNIQSYGVG
jgi:hypothetical protein